jgi:hypothetical protein
MGGQGMQGAGMGGGGRGGGLGGLGTVGHGAGSPNSGLVTPPKGGKAERAEQQPKAKKAALPAWWLRSPTDAQPKPQKGAVPKAVLALVESEGVQRCVELAGPVFQQAHSAWPRVMLQVRGGKLVKLRLEGGLDASACPQPHSEPVGKLPDGWVMVGAPR